ncbi:L domain-like protein [Backusella circina FSU 941]|nr:L domain-like protein [Backusella circina FSU 941]
MSSRKPAITPRGTKASSLRTQKPTKAEPQPEVKPKSRTAAKETGASAGVKAFMAQQRARLADQKPEEVAPVARKVSNVMTGAQRYGSWNDTAKKNDEELGPKKLQVLIKQAKSSGSMKLSSKGLKKLPEEVLKMYHVDPNKIVVDLSSMGGDSWYDAVELTKFNASDNEIVEIDERFGEEFVALTTVDFRSNQLKSLPQSFGQLVNLTTLQLPYNRFESVPSVLCRLNKLKELNLSHNLITEATFENNCQIEFLDLSDNQLGAVSFNDEILPSLRKLNLSGNQIEKLPNEIKWVKLEELLLNKNRLRCLYSGNEDMTLPSLIRIDVGQNNLECITTTGKLVMPKLIECSLVDNKLTENGLEGLKDALSIHTLDISSNQFSQVPPVVFLMESLTRLDIRGNQLRTLSYELGKLEKLTVIHCEGNPMRSYTSMNMTQLVESLKSNYLTTLEEEEKKENESVQGDNNESDVKKTESVQKDLRANPTKKLNLSNKKLAQVAEQDLLFEADPPATLLLDHNELTQLPISALSTQRYLHFLVHLNLENNKLVSFSLSIPDATFEHLKSLKLGNNRIKQLDTNDHISFPYVEEFNMNHNALVELPEKLPMLLPKLRHLSVSSNKLDKIVADSFEGVETLDLSNNDIGYLPPELALIKTIKEFVVYGNRFRIPRPAVVDQGTRAIMEFLGRRIAA